MSKPIVGQPDVEQGNRGWFTPRNLAIAAVIAVVIVVGAIIAWQMHVRNKSQSSKVSTTLAQAQAAYDKGEYVNALNIAKTVEAQAVGNGQKSKVYQMEAQSANGAGKYADAAHYYELKHKVDPGSANTDAYTLGVIYESLGQKDQALAQYQKALTYANSHKSQYGSDASAIQASIDALEKKQ